MTGHSAHDIIVVGAGAFGVWTALSAAEHGVKVRLIDMNDVGNMRASSGGASRNIRAAYGEDALYTQLAMEAWTAWHRRSADFGRRLLFPSGALRSGDVLALRAHGETFNRCGQRYELIDGSEASRRWPQLNYAKDELLFYEPVAGIVLASESLKLAAARLRALGGVIERRRVEIMDENGAPVCMMGGSRLDAHRIVIAAGPWLPILFPTLIGPLMRTPRRELLFFAAPPGDPRFMFDQLPCLADHDGWTSSDIGEGLKVAPRMRHTPLDPDSDPGPPSPSMSQAARQYLALRIPALANAPLISTYVGQLENTASEDFIIDTHPGNNRIIIAGGGSGHAFKFGPVLGARIAEFALNDDLPIVWRSRFALSSHRPVRNGEAG
jgi:sarcosine oxidase